MNAAERSNKKRALTHHSTLSTKGVSVSWASPPFGGGHASGSVPKMLVGACLCFLVGLQRPPPLCVCVCMSFCVFLCCVLLVCTVVVANSSTKWEPDGECVCVWPRALPFLPLLPPVHARLRHGQEDRFVECHGWFSGVLFPLRCTVNGPPIPEWRCPCWHAPTLTGRTLL